MEKNGLSKKTEKDGKTGTNTNHFNVTIALIILLLWAFALRSHWKKKKPLLGQKEQENPSSFGSLHILSLPASHNPSGGSI